MVRKPHKERNELTRSEQLQVTVQPPNHSEKASKFLQFGLIVASIGLPAASTVPAPQCRCRGIGAVQAIHDQRLRARIRQMASSRTAHKRKGFDRGSRQTAGICDRNGQRFGSGCYDHGDRGHRCRGVLARNPTEFRKVLAPNDRAQKSRIGAQGPVIAPARGGGLRGG